MTYLTALRSHFIPLQISYHVVFFGKEVSRAWVSNICVRSFTGMEEPEDMGQVRTCFTQGGGGGTRGYLLIIVLTSQSKRSGNSRHANNFFLMMILISTSLIINSAKAIFASVSRRDLVTLHEL